jgi:hypothetical protein
LKSCVRVLTCGCDQDHRSNVSPTARITSGIIVKAQFKLVAVFALIGMVAAPAAAALAMCSTSAEAGSQHACLPGCPMMAKTLGAPTNSVQAQPQSPSCCQISSSRPTPLSQLQVPTTSIRITPPADQATPVSAPVVSALDQSSESALPPSIGSPQAVLCTFLI